MRARRILLIRRIAPSSRAPAFGVATLPESSGTKVPTLRYSRQRRARNSLRSNRQALNSPAGAPLLGRRLQRQRRYAKRWRANTVTCGGAKERTSHARQPRDSRGWCRCAAFESSPEERSNAGAVEQKSALALFLRRRCEYRSGWHEVPDD